MDALETAALRPDLVASTVPQGFPGSWTMRRPQDTSPTLAVLPLFERFAF